MPQYGRYTSELGRCEAEVVLPEPNERQAARRGGHEGEGDAYFDDCAPRWCGTRGVAIELSDQGPGWALCT